MNQTKKSRDYGDLYDEVYSQDFGTDGKSISVDGPHGWIQWKGTEVCIDIYCQCGKPSHFDGSFLYHWKCPHCGTKYALGQNVKLIELKASQVREIEAHLGKKIK